MNAGIVEEGMGRMRFIGGGIRFSYSEQPGCSDRNDPMVCLMLYALAHCPMSARQALLRMHMHHWDGNIAQADDGQAEKVSCQRDAYFGTVALSKILRPFLPG